MRVEIRVNGKKISRKKANEEYGKERMDKRVIEAHKSHLEDPLELCSWMDGMSIRIIE